MIAIAIWKYAYIDKLPNIVNKHNNTLHETNKIKPTDVKSTAYIALMLKVMIKILNVKSAIM